MTKKKTRVDAKRVAEIIGCSTQFVLREFKNSLKHRSLDKVNPQETFIDLLGMAVEMFSHRDSF